jgi:DNA-binding CsgD family transcriptional regulator
MLPVHTERIHAQWTRRKARAMNHFDLVQSFIELCESGAPSIESLAGGFRRVIEALGFRYFACCSHVDPRAPPKQAIMLHNYPVAWERLYTEAKLYRIDPVLQRAERDPFPFFWDAAFRTGQITAPQRRLLLEAEELGLAHGYTVPIHLSWIPGALRASCSVVPDTDAVRRDSCLAVQIVAMYLYASVSRAEACWSTATSAELTHRQRQCLALVAQGKDDWAIGRVLRLSESTVHSHIERTKERFRVATRTQAVVQALMSGQISFGDVVRAKETSPGPSGTAARAPSR